MKQAKRDFKELIWPSFADAMVINLSVFVFLFILVSVVNFLSIKEIEKKNKEIEEKTKRIEQLEKFKFLFYTELSKIDPKLIEIKDGKPTIKESFLFESGHDEVSKEGINKLNFLRPQIAKTFLDLRNKIKKETAYKNVKVWLRISGYTDNKPMSSDVIKDNWDLSAKRATNVLRELAKPVAGISNEERLEKSMAISGLGEFQPLNDNSTEEKRRENRRVSIEIDYQESNSPIK